MSDIAKHLNDLLADLNYEKHLEKPERVIAKALLALLDQATLYGYDPIHTGEAQYGRDADRLIQHANALLDEWDVEP